MVLLKVIKQVSNNFEVRPKIGFRITISTVGSIHDICRQSPGRHQTVALPCWKGRVGTIKNHRVSCVTILESQQSVTTSSRKILHPVFRQVMCPFALAFRTPILKSTTVPWCCVLFAWCTKPLLHSQPISASPRCS